MSEINLELLKLFCMVAETGKIYKAAESLYISQPAVTQGIKKLEEQLGGSLFHRTPKGVVLTDQGKSLYSFIKPSIDTLENVPNKFSQYINLDEGKLSLKCGNSMGQAILFEPLKKFMRDYPKIQIEISSGLSSDSIEDIANGKVDMAIITLPFKNTKDNVEIIKYKPIKQVFYSTKEYLCKNNIDIDDINQVKNCTLIVPSKKSNTGTALYNYFKENNIDFFSHIISSNSTRKNIVESGIGIGVGIESFLENTDLVISKIKLPTLNVGIAVQKKDIASYATLKLLEYILKED